MTDLDVRIIEDSEWKTLIAVHDEPTLRWSGPEVACVLDGRGYAGVPLLEDRYGRVIDAPTSWFLHLTVSGSTETLSVAKYAYITRKFWMNLEVDWTKVDDGCLRRWRNGLIAAGCSAKHANQCIDVVVAFYQWAQEMGRVRDRIGPTPPGGLPYPIRLKYGKGRRRRLVSAVREPAGRTARLEVPDIDDMDTLYERLSGPNEALSMRNCIMADLAVEAGLRREEILSLNTDDIPSTAEIERLTRTERFHRLKIVGKGKTERMVPVLPELLTKIRRYIKFARPGILGPTTRPESALFLSSKTGRRVGKTWVSKLFSRAFGGTLHRLRARFASLVVVELARREMRSRGLNGLREDAILRAAAEVLGHIDIKTLKYYVDLAVQTLRREADGKQPTVPSTGVDVQILTQVARSNGSQQRRGRTKA